jgi:hypothetical protein
MPDTPITRGCRKVSTETSVNTGIVLASLIAVLLLFGGRVFDMANAIVNLSAPQVISEASRTWDTPMP